MLSDADLAEARRLLGREPTPVEAACLENLWSEHCSYRSTKHLLRTLPTTGPDVLIGPGDDAAIVRFSDEVRARHRDGEPQPPELRRPVRRRGHRRRRDRPRRPLHGRPPDRADGPALLRPARGREEPPPLLGRGLGDRRVRQLHRRPRRPGRAGRGPVVRGQPARERGLRRHGLARRLHHGPGPEARQQAPARGRPDGPRRPRRRLVRVARPLRGRRGRGPPLRPDRRPVHREAPDRGDPRHGRDREGAQLPRPRRGRPRGRVLGDVLDLRRPTSAPTRSTSARPA